jgi:hypothetical protein
MSYLYPYIEQVPTGVFVLATAIIGGALVLALAITRHTRMLVALADRERRNRGEAITLDSESASLRVVQHAIVESYGACGEIVSFQHIRPGAVAWMSFLGRSDTLYVIATQPQIRVGAPRARALKGPAAAELSGELNAVWRYFARNTWRTGWLKRHQRWYVLVTTREAMRELAGGATQPEGVALIKAHRSA